MPPALLINRTDTSYPRIHQPPAHISLVHCDDSERSSAAGSCADAESGRRAGVALRQIAWPWEWIAAQASVQPCSLNRDRIATSYPCASGTRASPANRTSPGDSLRRYDVGHAPTPDYAVYGVTPCGIVI
jgi:hypothetical protein